MDPKMCQSRVVWILLLGGALLLAGPGLAGDDPQPEGSQPEARPEESASDRPAEPSPKPETSEVRPARYQPPRWGVPRAKVGGGLRYGGQGVPAALARPLALAPEQLAKTVSASPTLFWHIDSVPEPGSKLVFYLTDYELTEPVAELELERPLRPGIQRIDLARYGVELQPKVEYDWAVVLVVDPERRARDIIANAYIQRVPEPETLAGEPCSFASCAEHGLWYDALTAISDAIEAAPHDTALLGQRKVLLEQAGLGAAVPENGS